MVRNRNDLKNNFLRQIIVRMDFEGVFESEIDKVMPEVKAFVKDFGFTNLEQRKNTESEMKLPIDRIQGERIDIRTIQKKVYTFSGVDGLYLGVSKDFACLNVIPSHYVPFDSYSDVIPGIVKIFVDNIPFFKGCRLGIRKINKCLFDNYDVIKEYFSKDYINNFSKPNISVYSSKNEMHGLENEYGINLMTFVDRGTYEKEETKYAVTVDIDVYLERNTKLSSLDSIMLSNMNDIIFSNYSMVLTDKFWNLLCRDEFCEKEVIGIEHN